MTQKSSWKSERMLNKVFVHQIWFPPTPKRREKMRKVGRIIVEKLSKKPSKAGRADARWTECRECLKSLQGSLDPDP